MAEKPTIPDFPTLPDFGQMITQACEVVASVRGIPYDFNGTLSLENKFVVLFKTVKEMFKAQDSLIKSYKELYEFIKSYFDNLDVQEEVNKKINELVKSGELLNLIKPSTIAETDKWLGEHITNPSNPPLDSSLSLETAAAQSKTVGNYFENLVTTYDGNVKLSMFENGNVDISGGKVIYANNKNRVRTKTGVTLALKAGDVIKLRDYNKYTVLVLETTKLARFGWMTFDFCVPIAGNYALNITTTADNVLMDVAEAFGQLEIIRNGCTVNNFNLIRANTDEKGNFLYQNYGVMNDEILHLSAGACLFCLLTGVSAQVSYFDNNGMFVKYEEYKNFHVFTEDCNILLRVKYYTSTELSNYYEYLNTRFHLAYNGIAQKTFYDFCGFSSYTHNMVLKATIKPYSSFPTSSANIILTKNRKTIGIDFSVVDISNYLYNAYYYRGTHSINYIIITHFHSDHTGALPSLVNTYNMSINGAVAFLPPLLTTENTKQLPEADRSDALAQQTEILNLLTDHNCTIIRPAENSIYNIDGLNFQFKNTSYDPYTDMTSEYYSTTYNDYSMVIEVEDNGFITTYTGDIQKQAMRYLAKTMRKANIMTSPHHGWLVRPENLIADFINNVNPDIVIAENGSEQKPGGVADIDGNGSPMTTWCEEHGIPNYATYENGTINVEVVDGKMRFSRPVIAHVKPK